MTSLPISSISKLIKIHRQSVRLIYNLPRYSTDSVTSLMKDLHWLPLVTRYIFKLLFTTHNVIHHNFPIYLCDLIKVKHIDRSSRFTHKCILETPYRSSKYGSSAFSISAPTHWNKLRWEIRCTENVSSFKTKLKYHLFRLAYNI